MLSAFLCVTAALLVTSIAAITIDSQECTSVSLFSAGSRAIGGNEQGTKAKVAGRSKRGGINRSVPKHLRYSGSLDAWGPCGL